MEIAVKDFHKELKRLREKAGLTQREAAKLAGYEWQRSWTAYESGDKKPTLAKAKELFAALGYDLVIKLKKNGSGKA